MRKILTLIMMLMLATGASADTVSILCKPGDTVNVRTGPHKSSETCGRYECGYTFETDGRTVRDSKGRRWVHMIDARLEVAEAWVCETYVQYSPVTIEQVTAVVDARGRTAVRNAPNGKRIKWAKNGTQVNVLAYSDEWAVTDIGYIAVDCLVFDGGEG